MASSPFYTIYVGSGGSHWHQMPIGAYVPAFKPKRRTNLVDVPLMPGAINIADRKYRPLTVPLVIEFHEDTSRALSLAIAAVIDILEDHEGEYIRAEDEETGGAEIFMVMYDELNEPDIAYRTYTKLKVATVAFPLLCTTDPRIWSLGIGDV